MTDFDEIKRQEINQILEQIGPKTTNAQDCQDNDADDAENKDPPNLLLSRTSE